LFLFFFEKISIKDSTSSATLSNEQFEQLLCCIESPTTAHSGIANPTTLGLRGFALTTFILSVFNSGDYLINHKLEPMILPVGLFYGGLAQLFVGIWGFKINNTFSAAAFTSYEAF